MPIQIMSREVFENAVLKIVRKRLSKRDLKKGICLDKFRNFKYNRIETNIAKAADEIICDTMYWNGTWFGTN